MRHRHLPRTIRERLRDRREELGLTQKHVSSRLNMSEAQISRLENGEGSNQRGIDGRVLRKWARAVSMIAHITPPKITLTKIATKELQA